MKNETQSSKRVTHHLVGNSIEPGGVMKGCAHSDGELRAYIAFGTLPNPDCPIIAKRNGETAKSRTN